MNQTFYSNDDTGITGFVLDELAGQDRDLFEASLEKCPGMKSEAEASREMASLLQGALSEEWQSRECESVEVEMTSLAVGELDEKGVSEELRSLLGSEETIQSIEAVRGMADLLRSGLESEWAGQVPVNVDDPALTGYVLNELGSGDSRRVEGMLRGSTVARKELESTRELVSLLSEGLEREWKESMDSEDRFSLVEAAGEENVVNVNFATAASPAKNRSGEQRNPVVLSLAAVLTGLLVVGGMTFSLRDGGSGAAVAALGSSGFSSGKYTWVNKEEGKATEVALAPDDSEYRPRLLLVDELVEPVGFADSGGKVNASFHKTSVGAPTLSAPGIGSPSLKSHPSLDSNPDTSTLRNTFDRVDSYLPPIKGGRVTYSVKEGIIGGNEARSIIMSDRRQHENGVESIYLQGIVTFPEGTDFEVDSLFPVKIGADGPKEKGASPASLTSEFDRVQKELEGILIELEGSNPVDLESVRRKLSLLLENHRELGNQLGAK